MDIIGYSERGAMNALFYGMALDKKNGESAMKKFIKLAGIGGEFNDFMIYNEFSLSDFGDPDLIITAKDESGKFVVFFVEAKASCGKYYNLQEQKIHHDEYMRGEDKYWQGHASNLFFQLRLKNLFWEYHLGKMPERKERNDRLVNSRGRERKIGKNVVVKKIEGVINLCDVAFYIAIIPESNCGVNTNNDYGFETHTITWETVTDEFEVYVEKTIKFNQGQNDKNKSISQILNNNV